MTLPVNTQYLKMGKTQVRGVAISLLTQANECLKKKEAGARITITEEAAEFTKGAERFLQKTLRGSYKDITCDFDLEGKKVTMGLTYV